MKKALLHSKFVLAVIIFSLTACTKSIQDTIDPEWPDMLGNGFFVLNQGNFTAGNASLSYVHYDSAKISNHVFFQNNGIPLGDVAQSMTIWNHYALVVVNNSSTIWSINKNTGKVVAKLSGFHSPRYLQIIHAEKAYVSDFYYPGLTVIQPSTFQIIGNIHTGKTTENLLMFGDKVFVSNWSQFNQDAENNSIQVIDVIKDQLVDSIELIKEPNSMVLDKNDRLWVLCSGGFMGEEVPALFRINAFTNEIEQQYNFPSAGMSPNQLVINATADTLFYINTDVFRMSVEDVSLPELAFIEAENRNFYSLSFDPSNKNVICGDAGNYMQPGYIYRFRYDGMLIDSLQAGIIPGYFAFN